MGRPSLYTEELVAEICARLSTGEPMAVICRDAHMPDRTTVWDWAQASADLSQRIARARDDGFDAIAADCLQIADQPNKRITADGEAHESDPQRDKLRVDTRLKLLAKWDPKRYGERLDVTAQVNTHVTSLPDADLLAELARLRGTRTDDPEGAEG